jgi:hypothetical protein
MRGAKALFLFDLITVAGFALRWLLYGLASIVRPGKGHTERAASSKDLMSRAWKIMRG